jgi:hypothetical protein
MEEQGSSSPLPTDKFSKRFRELSDNPGAIRKTSTINLIDDYGNTESWIIDLFRLEGGAELVFLQWINAKRSDRIVLPPEVTAAIARKRDSAISVRRRIGARQALATKRAAGIDPAAALKRHRARKGKKG